MAKHYDWFPDSGVPKAGDAMLDDCGFAEGKQRLERAHAARAAGGEQYCGDIIHVKEITKKHYPLMPELFRIFWT